MFPDVIEWPRHLLPPQSSPFDPRPFSRSGGRSLGGIVRTARTDRGYWVGSYNGIVFRRGTEFTQRRVWNAIRTQLNGMTGLIAVPVCSTAVWANETRRNFAALTVPHDDDAPFDDGTEYSQDVIELEMATAAPLGATVVVLALDASLTAAGVRFSYQHAMYETGRILSEPAPGFAQVEIFPAIRFPIPAGAMLQASHPTVLCRLASDSEMDIEFGAGGMPRPSVNFVEAVDVWNDLAMGVTFTPAVLPPVVLPA